jgi:NADPH2:quinone reductase
MRARCPNGVETASNAIEPTTVSDTGIPFAQKRTVASYGLAGGGVRPPRSSLAACENGLVKAIRITEFGGPEVLEQVDLPEPEAGEGETLVDVSFAGVNFADTHATKNDYIARQTLPLIPGVELAGRTRDGRRVAAVVRSGAYAQTVAVPDDALVDIPEGVSEEQAAALLIQGLSADAILRISANLQPGETVVVNAAAGGTGSLAVQIARRLRAGRIIALASSPDKRELTLELGADVALDSRSYTLGSDLVEANDGRMVDVVLEMAGGRAFDECLSVLAPFGRLVAFGIASKEQNTVRSGSLMKNSRAVVGFWINHLLARPELARETTARVLDAAAAGELKTVIGAIHPLSGAAEVHRMMAARRTSGKMLLDPSQ